MNDVHGAVLSQSAAVADCRFPKPFDNGLEFNAPVHGTWNIVHIGYEIPGAHQIYICADNCMRGVVMTAAEMGELARFSGVVLEEDDMVFAGRIEQTTIEGVSDVLRSLDSLPPAAIIFPVCAHKFMGCDMEYVYRCLEERFPKVKFVRAFMDPIMQKRGTSPDVRLRRAMLDIIDEQPVNPLAVNVAGCDVSMAEDNDIRKLLVDSGCIVREMCCCSSFEDYMNMGQGRLNICCNPAGVPGVKNFSGRFGRDYIWLPFVFDYGKTQTGLELLAAKLGKSFAEDKEAMKNDVESAFAAAEKVIMDTEIALDYTAVARPLSLGRFLIEHRFNLTKIYLDVIDTDEEEDFRWLQANAPGLVISSTVDISGSVLRRDNAGCLAIGQKAAWFEGTAHFVNIVEGGGLYGYSGMIRFAGLMEEALLEEKDTRDIVPRKGLGCASLI